MLLLSLLTAPWLRYATQTSDDAHDLDKNDNAAEPMSEYERKCRHGPILANLKLMQHRRLTQSGLLMCC